MTVSLHHEFDERGDAPVLVLSHSLGTDSTMWAPQLPVLRQYFRVLLADTRGHGRSPSPPGPYSIAELAGDFLALLDRLGLERVSWCGISLGGMLGMWLAAHEPGRIDRLVLACTAPHLPPARNWTERAATVRRETTAAILDGSLDRWFTARFRARDPLTVAAHAQTLLGTDAEGYAGCCEAIARMDLRANLAHVTAPTLVLHGTDDPAIPMTTGATLAESIAPAGFTAIPGAHLATVESAKLATTAITAHLTTDHLPPGSRG